VLHREHAQNEREKEEEQNQDEVAVILCTISHHASCNIEIKILPVMLYLSLRFTDLVSK
jgi:hypothetical protein